MSQTLVEELKRRAEGLLEKTKKHLESKTPLTVDKYNYQAVKDEMLTKLKSQKDLLQTRADVLYKAIDDLEQEQGDVDDALEELGDLITAIEDLPQ